MRELGQWQLYWRHSATQAHNCPRAIPVLEVTGIWLERVIPTSRLEDQDLDLPAFEPVGQTHLARTQNRNPVSYFIIWYFHCCDWKEMTHSHHHDCIPLTMSFYSFRLTDNVPFRHGACIRVPSNVWKSGELEACSRACRTELLLGRYRCLHPL